MNGGKGQKSCSQPIGRVLQRRMIRATSLTGKNIENWKQCLKNAQMQQQMKMVEN